MCSTSSRFVVTNISISIDTFVLECDVHDMLVAFRKFNGLFYLHFAILFPVAHLRDRALRQRWTTARMIKSYFSNKNLFIWWALHNQRLSTLLFPYDDCYRSYKVYRKMKIHRKIKLSTFKEKWNTQSIYHNSTIVSEWKTNPVIEWNS